MAPCRLIYSDRKNAKGNSRQFAFKLPRADFLTGAFNKLPTKMDYTPKCYKSDKLSYEIPAVSANNTLVYMLKVFINYQLTNINFF